MQDDVLLTAREGDVVTLTLNRPEKRNAMTVPMLTALRDAFRDLAGANDVRAWTGVSMNPPVAPK